MAIPLTGHGVGKLTGAVRRFPFTIAQPGELILSLGCEERRPGAQVHVAAIVHSDRIPVRSRSAGPVSPPSPGGHDGGMAAGPRRPLSGTADDSGAYAEDLALYREKFLRRLPASLDELCGPARGIVDLPLHVAWSGMTSYDLEKPRQRMGLYRTVLHEGLHDDLPRYLNKDLLVQMWPVLRGLVGRTVRTVWEDAFPQIAARARAAA